MAGKKYKSQQNELPFDINNSSYTDGLKRIDKTLTEYLRSHYAIDLNTKPAPDTAPRIFLYEDGKLVSPWEKNMTPYDLALETTKGKVFLFPPEKKEPVQLQGTMSYSNISLGVSDPLKAGVLHPVAPEDLPREPRHKPAPKWYHRLFKFWGNNRRICREYDIYRRQHAKWENDVAKALKETEDKFREQDKVAGLVAEQYAPQREQVLEAERQITEQLEREKAMAALKIELKVVDRKLFRTREAEEVAENVFARDPKPRDEWAKKSYDDIGKYELSDFQKLTKSDIDLAQIKLGDKAMTERGFASLVLFGTLEPENAVSVYRNSAGNPEALLDAFEKEGYTREDGKEFLLRSNCNNFTVSVLDGDGRFSNTFEHTVNPGRKKAEEALKAYPQDKSKLADILSRAVEIVGMKVATETCNYDSGPSGYYAMSKMSEELLTLAEQDPELMKLAKETYDKREKSFCERSNKMFNKSNEKLKIETVSFENRIKTIKSFNRFAEIERKGLEAEKALLEAEINGTPLSSDQRKAYTKDALKCNLIAGLYNEHLSTAKAPGENNGLNTGFIALDKYCNDLSQRAVMPALAGGGSTLPSNMPAILRTGVEAYLVPKPPIISLVADPEQLSQLDREVENLMDYKQLDKLSLTELNNALKPRSALTGLGLMEEFSKANPKPQKDGPAEDLTASKTAEKNVRVQAVP